MNGTTALIYLWGTIFGTIFLLGIYEAAKKIKNINHVKPQKKAK